MADYRGTQGNDLRSGKAGNDTFDMTLGGDDTVFGNSGNDSIRMGGTLNAADRLSGGEGSDTLELGGDYAKGLVLNAHNFDSIETLRLDAGHDYLIKIESIVNFNVTAHQGAVVVFAQTLKVGDNAGVDASAVIEQPVVFHGGAGDDKFIGGAKDNYFYMAIGDNLTPTGGNDTVIGGASRDYVEYLDAAGAGYVNGGGGDDELIFYAGTNSLAKGTDKLQGGDGYDVITIVGLSAHQISLTPQNFGGFEKITLLASGDIKLMDGVAVTAAADGYYEIDASQSGDLSLDANLERNVGFHYIGGTASESFKGGAKADIIDLQNATLVTALGGAGDDFISIADSHFNDGDLVMGGAGYDTISIAGSHGELVLSGSNGSGFEHVISSNGLIFKSGSVVGASAVTVEAVGNGDHRHFDASAMTTARFNMTTEGMDDTLTGGNGADTLSGANYGDRLDGGGGNDTLLSGFGPTVMIGGAGADRFTYLSVPQGSYTLIRRGDILDLTDADTIDLSKIDANANIAGDQAFRLVASFTGHAGELVIVNKPGSNFTRFDLDTAGDGMAHTEFSAEGDHADFHNFVL